MNVNVLEFQFGVYIYNYCNSVETIESGANWTIQKLNGKTFELPVFLDMEDTSLEKLGKEKITNLICKFNYMLEQNGFVAGVYTNRHWHDKLLDNGVIKKRYKYWIAHYTSVDNLYTDFYIWQNTSLGKIDGIVGNVDTNYMYGEFLNVEKHEKSIEELANEVINGEWGNGEERKNNLQNEGYSYQDVQNKVNEILLSKVSYYSACDSSYTSIVDALKSIGVDSSLNNRKEIANKNGISNYTGTAIQNNKLLKLLKNGELKK